MNMATNSIKKQPGATSNNVPSMSNVDLEMQLMSASRLTRALHLAIKGLADNKEFVASQDELDAIEELSWVTHRTTKAAEETFFATQPEPQPQTESTPFRPVRVA